MRQIVYFSTAAGRQDVIATAGIVAVSRVRNLSEGITGLLVAGGHRYLQVIEGPTVAIEALLGRLRRDDRHLGMTVLVDRRIECASFTGWSMALTETSKLEEFASLSDMARILWGQVQDPKLRQQVDCFVRTFARETPDVRLAVNRRH